MHQERGAADVVGLINIDEGVDVVELIHCGRFEFAELRVPVAAEMVDPLGISIAEDFRSEYFRFRLLFCQRLRVHLLSPG